MGFMIVGIVLKGRDMFRLTVNRNGRWTAINSRSTTGFAGNENGQANTPNGMVYFCMIARSCLPCRLS
jgi:nicotinamide mononucleotide (NMN) deamidase PncC